MKTNYLDYYLVIFLITQLYYWIIPFIYYIRHKGDFFLGTSYIVSSFTYFPLKNLITGTMTGMGELF